MKNTLCVLLSTVTALLIWGCDSKSPQTPAAPAPLLSQPTMDAALADITTNYEIERVGAKVGVWTTDYPAALKLAEETKLPILLNFTGSDWCKYCKLLVRDVFSQKDWQDWIADKMILVCLDFPRNQALISEDLLKQNSELREKYQVEAFPTLLVLEDNGSPLGLIELRDDNSPHTVKRNLKAIFRRRQTVIKKMISGLPDDSRPAIEAIYEKITADKQKISELAKKHDEEMRKLQQGLIEMSEKTETALLQAILQQRTPELQQKYAEAKKLMEELSQQMNEWLSKEPEQNEQNTLIYKNFQKQLQEQSDIIADIIDPE